MNNNNKEREKKGMRRSRKKWKKSYTQKDFLPLILE